MDYNGFSVLMILCLLIFSYNQKNEEVVDSDEISISSHLKRENSLAHAGVMESL